MIILFSICLRKPGAQARFNLKVIASYRATGFLHYSSHVKENNNWGHVLQEVFKNSF